MRIHTRCIEKKVRHVGEVTVVRLFFFVGWLVGLLVTAQQDEDIVKAALVAVGLD